MMGTAIAAAHVRHRLPVVIHDANGEALGRATASIAAELGEAEGGCLAGSLRRFVHPTAELAEVGRCDLVIESIVEISGGKAGVVCTIAGPSGHAYHRGVQ